MNAVFVSKNAAMLCAQTRDSRRPRLWLGALRIAHVAQIIQDVANQVDVVGLTIAEHLPQVQIKLKRLLENLPLLRQS